MSAGPKAAGGITAAAPCARTVRRTFANAPAARPEAPAAVVSGACPARRRAWRMLLERSPLKGVAMLWTIAVVLLVLWALGLLTSTTLGGFVHLLLVAAVAVLLVRLIQGRRVA